MGGWSPETGTDLCRAQTPEDKKLRSVAELKDARGERERGLRAQPAESAETLGVGLLWGVASSQCFRLSKARSLHFRMRWRAKNAQEGCRLSPEVAICAQECDGRLLKQFGFALNAAGRFGAYALEGSVRLGEERSANSLLSTARRKCEGREVDERHAGCG